MKTGRYILVVLWEDGEKFRLVYESELEANDVAEGYEMAFGKQVAMTAVMPEYV